MENKGVENNFSSFPLHSFSYSVVKTFAFFFSLLPSTSKVISLCFRNINPACSKEQQLTGSASFRVSIWSISLWPTAHGLPACDPSRGIHQHVTWVLPIRHIMWSFHLECGALKEMPGRKDSGPDGMEKVFSEGRISEGSILHLYRKALCSYTEAVTVEFPGEKRGDGLCLWFLAVQLLSLILSFGETLGLLIPLSKVLLSCTRLNPVVSNWKVWYCVCVCVRARVSVS